MGNFISHYMAQNNRVNAITVTKDGIIVKHRRARPRHSFVRALLGPCCGQRSALDVDYAGQVPGVARFKRRRVFQRQAAGLVAPVHKEDLSWAIPRHNFKAFVERDIFVTSKCRRELGKGVTDDSSEALSPTSSTHSANDDAVADANLQTLRRFRKKCGLVDNQVEFEDDKFVVPFGFIEAKKRFKAKGSAASAGSDVAVRKSVIGESSETKALPKPKPVKIHGFQTIIPVRPSPLVDVKAGDIPVAVRSPILLNKKDGGGPKGTYLPGAASPRVSAHPPSSSVIPPPAKHAGKNALAAKLVVDSVPVVAKIKTLGNTTVLPLSTMLGMDVTLPSEVQVSAPRPAKLQGILKMGSENETKTVSAFPGTSPRVYQSNRHTVIHTFPMREASDSEEEIEYFDVDGSKISKPRITSGDYCPSQVELMAQKSELPSVKKMYGCRSSAEKPSNQASAGKKKKKTSKKKKKHKAKRRDSFAAPMVNSVDRRHRDTGVLADHQKIYDEGELNRGVPAAKVFDYKSGLPAANVVDYKSGLPAANVFDYKSALPAANVVDYKSGLPAANVVDYKSALPAANVVDYKSALPAANVVDYVSQVKDRPVNGVNNNNSDSEEEIEYFYSDGSKIPKGSVDLRLIGKSVPLVAPPNSCSAQTQSMVWEPAGVKPCSLSGKWK